MRRPEQRLMASSSTRRASTSKTTHAPRPSPHCMPASGLLHSGDQHASPFLVSALSQASRQLHNQLMLANHNFIIHYLVAASLFFLLPLHSRSHPSACTRLLPHLCCSSLRVACSLRHLLSPKHLKIHNSHDLNLSCTLLRTCAIDAATEHALILLCVR